MRCCAASSTSARANHPLATQADSPAAALDNAEDSGNGNWLNSLGGVLLIFAVYAALHIILRVAASPNLSQDDVMAVLYSQTLELGYTPRQPPLYDWMLWTVQQVTGPTLISFLALKYTLLIASAGFIYSAARRIFGSPLWATLSALSLLLLYQIGWNIHEGVTHTSVMICTIAATFWAFTRIAESQSLGNYLILGLAIGLGALTKYGYAAFLITLVAAALLQPASRQLLQNTRILAAAALAIAITAPFAAWLFLNQHDLGTVYAGTVTYGEGGHWARAMRGVFLTFRSMLTFLSPLILVVPLVFPGALNAAGHAFANVFKSEAGLDWEKLLLHMTLISLGLLLGAALLTGASNLRMRYMHPFFLLTPLWLIAMARRGMTKPVQTRIFVVISLVFALAVVVMRTGYLYVGEPPFCVKCRQMIPYDALAEAIRDRGFRSGTIIAGYRHTAGNMRQRFPEARVVALRRPHVVPTIRPDDREGQIALVWDVGTEGAELPGGAREQVESLGGRIERAPETIRIPWTHTWRDTGYRHTDWNLIVIDLTPK